MERPVAETPVKMNERGPTQRWRRLFFGWTRFSVATFLWLSVIAAILMLWYQDHARLKEQLGIINGVKTQAWSVDQLLGAPDTAGFGDMNTAWASASQDASPETLVVEFPQAVNAGSVDIHETFNPGSVVSVSSVAMNGSEKLL